MIRRGLQLSARFTITVILLLGIFALGIAFLIRSINSIETMLEQSSAEHVDELTVNSVISREIFELSSRVRLLEQNFLYDEAILSEEGFNIDEQLQRIRNLSDDQSFTLKMDDFILDFHRFLGNSVTLNRIIKEQSVIDGRLEKQINALDFAIATSQVTKLTQDPNLHLSNDIDIMHLIRETYLTAGKVVGTVRSSLTPDTEQVVIIKVRKELSILELHLANMRDLSPAVTQAIKDINTTLRAYKMILRKMTANLQQRWGVMADLIDSQDSLIAYVEETEANVHKSAVRISSDLSRDLVAMRGWIAAIGVLSLIVGILMILHMVRQHITIPLNKLKQSFKEVESNHFDKPISLARNDEWSVIEDAFNRMASRLKTTYDDLAAEQTKLNQQAHHDALTGLANRLLIYRKLESTIQAAQQHNAQFTLLFLDIDHFKTVNDSLGHHVGDLLLQQVAGRLLDTVAAHDTVSRLGGDEFMILTDLHTSKADGQRLAETINTLLRKPFYFDDTEVYVGSSVGVCHFPNHGQDVDTLVRNADTAMYHAKRGGRDNYRIYEDSMTNEAHELMSISSGLKQALRDQELFVEYQPQYDIESGQIVGAEALVRWQHPTQGVLLPGHFLDVAEQTGIIVDIDDYVFDLVFHDLQGFMAQGIISDDFKLSVNLSGRKLFSERLLESLKTYHDHDSSVASKMIIELTERDMITQLEQCTESIEVIQQLGFEVAMDDFGTGYSSLGSLKQLPINILKMDRSFISELDNETYPSIDLTITSSVLDIARALNLCAVAEGVETQRQLEILKQIGCQVAQGYYLSRPISKTALITLLKETPVRH